MANTWGELSWGLGAFGEQNDISVSLTGIELTSSLNSVSEVNAGSVVDLTGSTLTVTPGTTVVDIAVEFFATGNLLNITSGSLDPAPDVELSGTNLEATATLGNVLAYNQFGWGRYVWGEWDWGDTGLGVKVFLDGVALSSNLGSVITAAEANVIIDDPTDQFSLLIQEGNMDPGPDANITGIQMTMSLGSISITADANIDLTGNAMTMVQGSIVVDLNTPVDVTGNALSMALNSVDFDADANVYLTGNQLTMNTGSVYTLIWNRVNTGTTVTWTPVDTAA